MDDKKTYEYLKMIINKGSISEAAKFLYVSQPSLSQYIIRLEEELGAKILLRETNNVRLTEFGEILYWKLNKINLIKNSIENDIHDINNLKRGKVTIGALNYHSLAILAYVLPEFIKEYPNIEVNIIEGTLLEIEALASEGKVDFSLILSPFRSKNLNYDYLITEDILIACNKDNKIARLCENNEIKNKYHSIDLRILENENFIIPTPEKGLRRTFEEATTYMSKLPKVLMETNDLINYVILAASGMGVTFCTNLIADIYKADIPVTFLSPVQNLTSRKIVAAYTKTYPLSKSAKKFLDTLIEHCKNNF